MLALSERLWRHHPRHGDLRVEWRRAALQTPLAWPPHDLVVLSYVIGELVPETLRAVVLRAAQAAKRAIAIVEPGTPRGYHRVLAARDILIAAGFRVLAPCPHDHPCPLRGTPDWCHFAARLARSRLHRQLKGGDLGWEDEKFSYVIAGPQALEPHPASAEPSPPPVVEARVIRHPIKGTGHVTMTLCTPKASSSAP